MSQTGGQSRKGERAQGAAVASDVWLAPVARLCLCGPQVSLAVLFGTVHSYALGHSSPTCLCDGVNKSPDWQVGGLAGWLESSRLTDWLRQCVATWGGSKRDHGDVTENAGLTMEDWRPGD